MSRVKHHRACTRYAQPLSNVQIPAIPSLRVTQPLYFLHIQNWLVSAHSTATSTRVVSTHTPRCGLNLLESADTKIGGWGDIPPYRQMCGSPFAGSSSSDSCQLLTASLNPFVLMFARPSFANSFGMHVYVMTPGGGTPCLSGHWEASDDASPLQSQICGFSVPQALISQPPSRRGRPSRARFLRPSAVEGRLVCTPLCVRAGALFTPRAHFAPEDARCASPELHSACIPHLVE